jgi:hypothetical protein
VTLWCGSGSTSLLVQDNVFLSDNLARGPCSSSMCAGGAIVAYDKSILSLGAGCSVVNNRSVPALAVPIEVRKIDL